MTVKDYLSPSDSKNMDAVATIVAAYAQRTDVSPEQIVDLAARLVPVFGSAAPQMTSVAAISTPNAERPAALETQPEPKASIVPALPLDQAVTDDKVYCLCCGKGFTMLKRHLKAEHGLTEEEYRKLFALPDSMPLVAPNYSVRKAAYAKQVGLGKYRRESGAEEHANAG